MLKNFSMFTLIGGGFFVLAVGLNTLAIDVMGWSPGLASLLVISGLFVAKYYCYLLASVIVPSFWRYTVANLAVTLLSTLTIWLLVRYGGLSGGMSTGVALSFFFLVRYFVLDFLNVIRKSAQG
ncbi:hypothetical protein [Wenzhouxiangella sp. XN24]|uniref:hypothetical protein n=1 Tax=Wenzhouxiangella sp. XN24 TaxID=2713569 RepID=UPI0013E9D6F6|nr:hypothetical protein [Wenzhouxiangella sp. XN24]NGX16867.1 hypothetical protein [Wenzhouxiangella sp. XN24]